MALLMDVVEEDNIVLLIVVLQILRNSGDFPQSIK